MQSSTGVKVNTFPYSHLMIQFLTASSIMKTIGSMSGSALGASHKKINVIYFLLNDAVESYYPLFFGKKTPFILP